MPAHRGAVGTPSVGGAGVYASVDVHDVAVAQFDEVVHSLPDALGVLCMHGVHVRARDPAAHGDERSDVDAAVAAVWKAFDFWSNSSLSQRTRIMFSFRELVVRHEDELARMISRGKVVDDALGEIVRGREVVEYAAGIVEVLKGGFSCAAALPYACATEYQRRGLVHFHAVVRLYGPDGAADPAPAWAHPDMLDDAVTAAAGLVALDVAAPDGTSLTLTWGSQVDVKRIEPATAAEVEDENGQISEQRLAAYIAKYATKGTGKTEAADRPIRSQLDIDFLKVSPHHRRIIQTRLGTSETCPDTRG